MKTEKVEGEMNTAYTKPLPSPIPFSGEFQAFENINEVRNAGEFPSEKQIVGFINNLRKQKAISAARTAALEAAGIMAPDLKTDVLLQLRQVYKVYIAKGKSHDEARALASAAIDEAWPDDAE
jgi:hypothetical protein